jgi:hypothetical protein
VVLNAPSARYHTFIASDATQDRQGIIRLKDTALEAVVPLRIALKPARLVHRVLGRRCSSPASSVLALPSQSSAALDTRICP